MDIIFTIVLSLLFVFVIIYCTNKNPAEQQLEEWEIKELIYKQTGLKIGEIYEIVSKKGVSYHMMIGSYKWKKGILYCHVLTKGKEIGDFSLTVSEIKLILAGCKIYKT